jgi:hypothetical protein
MGYPVFATPVFGGYGWGYGVPFWGVPVTFTGYPYGGYSWPYAYDGGWTLASGIGPMAVEAAVIERGLRGVLPQGQRLTPGRYKMTISIEPTSDGRSDTPQK